MADDLGEYKVVISADFSELQSALESVKGILSDAAEQMSDQITSATSNAASSFGKLAESITNTGKSGDGLAPLKENTEGLGGAAGGATDAYKTLEQQVKATALAAQKAFGTDAFDGARTSYQEASNKLNDFKNALNQSDLVSKQNQATNKQYWKDVEAGYALNSSLLQGQMREETSTAKAISDAKARQNQAADKQYYADYEAGIKRRSSLLKEQMEASAASINAVAAPVAKVQRQFGMLDGVVSKLYSHLQWVAAAAILIMPAMAVKNIASVEQQMAGMIQTLPQLHNNQALVNQTAKEFITIAEQYGMSVDKIIEAGKLWSRGYKSINDVMRLTSLSAKLAVADMVDVTVANKAVESVINQYGRQGDAVSFATHVVDAWTNVAHNAQSSAQDLAEALMRSGAAAHAVGVDFDTTTALASTMIKTTGLEGANIGNALKSLFSSIHSDKAITDLTNLGIEVYKFDADGTKHFRDVSQVLMDLMLTSHETSQNMAKDLQDISGGRPKLAA